MGGALYPLGDKREEPQSEPEEEEQAMWIMGRILNIASEFFLVGLIGPGGRRRRDRCR